MYRVCVCVRELPTKITKLTHSKLSWTCDFFSVYIKFIHEIHLLSWTSINNISSKNPLNRIGQKQSSRKRKLITNSFSLKSFLWILFVLDIFIRVCIGIDLIKEKVFLIKWNYSAFSLFNVSNFSFWISTKNSTNF